ncbi:MAG: cytochrome-c peroxidase [Deltaproteobacteria bacterium]|nr:cytochrome-c peroxidase [Deltaproteobacteria bacterium]
MQTLRAHQLEPSSRIAWAIVLSSALVCGWILSGCDRRAKTSASALAPATAPAPAIVPAQASAFYADTFEKRPSVAEKAALGRKLFHAPELSASGTQSCATCHQPEFAYASGNDLATQPGGTDGHAQGERAVPTLRYLDNVPRFDEHYQDSDGDGTDQGPAGGFTWDGRAQTAHEQARLPLFSPLEMANRDPASLIARVRAGPVAAAIRETFGEHALDTPESGLKAILLALEIFQQDAAEFHPFDSKFDAFLRGRVALTAQEQHGLQVFNDKDKGNCAVCHLSQLKNGAFPVFTDFGFVALGVPRNRALPANADPSHFDLGLCGPLRTDLTKHDEYCGMFRTPTLRNVTRKKRFFHNGAMKSLEDVVRFYVERDVHPEKFYAHSPRGLVLFDDLPPRYHANVNREPPFGRTAKQGPALTAAEQRDLIVFLHTLEDGYRADASSRAESTGHADSSREHASAAK